MRCNELDGAIVDKEMPSHYDVAVVGAGIAGLTSAALLAHSGAQVLLLEHHDKPGGCAGFFSIPSKWGDFTFPTGATAALGLEAGGLHAEIFRRLGVDCSAHPIDRLAVYLPDIQIDMWHEADKWRQARRTLPGNRAGQELFWKLQELVADAGWFALSRKPSLPLQKWADVKRNLALADPRLIPMIGALPFSVGEVMKLLRVDRDQAFSALVNLQLLITTQSLSHRSPLSNSMAGLDLWRHGAWHPLGGVGTIARTLTEAFTNLGGEIQFSNRVTKIQQSAGLWKLETANGEYTAKHVIANVPLTNLRDLIEPTPRITGLESRAGKPWGAVMIYAGVRNEAIPANFPLHAQILTRYSATPPYVKAGTGDDVFLSLSWPDDEQSAPIGLRTLNISTHVRLDEWNNLSKAEYREKKKLWRDKLLTAATHVMPDLKSGLLFAIAGTPSTWEEYTLRQGGGVGGAPLTRKNANFRALPSRLGLENFHLVGDNTFPGQGTVACALSGLNAWSDITGG